MIIDFHTHVFPDALAPKAGASLSATAGFPMFSDLTVAGQLAVMAEDGIDHAVVLNTVTNTRQVDRKSTRLNSSHAWRSRMPSSA